MSQKNEIDAAFLASRLSTSGERIDSEIPIIRKIEAGEPVLLDDWKNYTRIRQRQLDEGHTTALELVRLSDVKRMNEAEAKDAALQIIKGFGSYRSVAIWNLYALGYSQRNIGEELKLSVGTVNSTLKELELKGLVKIRKTGGACPDAIKKSRKARNTTHRD